MKTGKTTFVLLIFICFAINPYDVSFLQQNLTIPFPKNLDRPDLAVLQDFERTKNPKLDRPTPEVLPEIAKQYQKFLRSDPPGSFKNPWMERGPNNVSGRTRTVLIDKRDPTHNTVWSGGVGGGLWKTTNFLEKTPQWNSINDFFKNIAISTIAQDPSDPDNIYFGTGEGFFNVDAIRGLGIWKSKDGGNSWNQLTSTNNSIFAHIQKICINQSGNIYAATRVGGVQYSRDGGTSWERVMVSDDPTDYQLSKVGDIEIAANGDVYFSTGFFSGQRGRVFRLINGNPDTWSEITPALNSFNRIEIALAPNDASRVYLLCEGSDRNVSHIFRSNNFGSSWIEATVPTIVDRGRNPIFTRNQAWYDLIAAVDPTNANRIFIGGVDGLRSSDGGDTWQQITTWVLTPSEINAGFTEAQLVHADHHFISFLPGSNTKGIWCTDGGIFYSENLTSSKPTFIDKNKGFNITQFYSCAIHPDSARNYYLAGSQDNGTQQFDGEGLVNTDEITGGDGGYCFIDQNEPNIQISTFTKNNINITTNKWNTWKRVLRDSDSGLFINPADYDSKLNILYTARNLKSLYRISKVGSSNPVIDTLLIELKTTAKHLSVSPFGEDHSVLFVGSANLYGKVPFYKITNAETNNYQVTDVGSPEFRGSLSSVAFGSTEDDLLVTFSNYGVISVWQSKDGGKSWLDKEGDLPDMPVRWSLFNPHNDNQALLATEMGIWYCEDLSAKIPHWQLSNQGLANTRVDMLRIRSSDQEVVAATHGRGLFTNNGFKIAEICAIPENAFPEKIGHTHSDIKWIANNQEDTYILRYRQSGEQDWIEVETSSSSHQLTGLAPCQQYEFQLKSQCGSIRSNYSASTLFTSKGCEDKYCALYGNGNNGWIQKVTVGDLTNESGNDLGYNFFPTKALVSYGGQEMDFNIETENIKGSYVIEVWIDINTNSQWESNEKVFFTETANASYIGKLKIPETTSIGVSRLRILVTSQSLTLPCSAPVFESEDYNLILKEVPHFSVTPKQVTIPSQAGYGYLELTTNQVWEIQHVPQWIKTINPSAGSGNKILTFSFDKNEFGVRKDQIILKSDFISRGVDIEQMQVLLPSELKDLVPEVKASAGQVGQYLEYQINYTIGEPIVSNIKNSGFWLSQGFQQGEKKEASTAHESPVVEQFTVFPNPAIEFIVVKFKNNFQGRIELIDFNGQTAFSQVINSEFCKIEVAHLTSAVYYLNILPHSGKESIQKIIKL